MKKSVQNALFYIFAGNRTLMENSEEILKKINSGDPEALQEAIQAVKENGDAAIADQLLNCLESAQIAATKNAIINLLADVKDNRFKEVLIQKLKSTTTNSLKKELLRIVWESSLDYSAYVEYFMPILQDDDFELAFEASTVIEHLVPRLSAEQCAKLNSIFANFPKEKRFLTENILKELNDAD